MVGLLKNLEKLIKGGILLSFSIMIIAVVVQVFARTFMEQPPLWTEESSRVSLLFIMSLGVGASILTGDLVNVDLAVMTMPKRMRRFCELASSALVALFGLMLIPGSWDFTVSGSWQTSPILQLQMQYVYVSMLLFSLLITVFGFVKFLEVLLGTEDPEFGHNKAEV